ncbi:MAG TPA: GGDEF domain-containing protein [Candidatus Aquabacterium excrementipullorum]|nr:GGDEF domain-containing protein [Candidatus Aquabacterium excrementipullorum]
MNDSRSLTSPSASPSQRQHRDDPVRRKGADGDAVDTAVPPLHEQTDGLGLPGHAPAVSPRPEPGSLEAVAAQGHRWLRFPSALERQFNADTLQQRRKFLTLCAIVGILGIWAGAWWAEASLPNIAGLARQLVTIYLGIATTSLVVLLLTPRRWQRMWQSESAIFANAFGLNLVIVWACMASGVDTAYTQSGAVIAPVMFACIAARLRFIWALACALLTLVVYVVCMHGQTPLQQLVVAGNIKLQLLSFAFALVANYTLEYAERRNWVLRKLQEKHRAVLHDTSEQLRRLSVRDALTGLYNRRQFDADLAAAWHQCAAAGQPLALLMLDVDHFKLYNDAYGHPAGDACLTRVGQALARVAQAHGGMAARLGGEEFALVLPRQAESGSRVVAEALCAAVRQEAIEHRASSVAGHVTVSVGVALAWPGQGGRTQALLSTADRALYLAKAQGRDRVAILESLLASSEKVVAEQAMASGDAVLTSEADVKESPETPYLQTLEGGFAGLRFPPQLERRYRKHNMEDRRKLLGINVLIGMLIYNLFVLLSRDMFPDVSHRVLVMQGALSVFLFAAALPIYARKRLAPNLYESVFCVGSSMVAVISAWMLSQSQETSTLAYCVALVLVPMFSGVGARQPFWFTCVPAVITVVVALALFKPVGEVQSLVFSQSAFQIVNTTLYTLILAYTLDYGARKAWLLAQVDRLQGEALHEATERLHRLSVQDPLTGLPNRRQFEADLLRLWRESARERQPVGLLIVDVDFFKLYNDGYGHPEGDRCLQRLAGVLREVAERHQALVARLGGEEFSLMLPGADAARMLAVGQAVGQAVREAGIAHRHSRVAGHVTVSIGAGSLMPLRAADRHQLLKVADQALYRAKTTGRDRVAAAGEPPAHGLATLPPRPAAATGA